MRWLDSTTDSMDVNLSELWEAQGDRGACCDTVHGVARAGHDSVAEKQLISIVTQVSANLYN